MDLKNVLNEHQVKKENIETKVEEIDDGSIRVHKKPLQLRDIESRSATKRRLQQETFESDENIRTLLEKEKEDIFKQTWNKLENGLKINRLKIYIENEQKEKNLSKEQTDQLTNILLTSCHQNKLNRNSDVIYDRTECIITNIKILKMNENGKYIIDIVENKKAKSASKSKSNIERFIKSKN
jgi:hypothetical protein|tara:strand:+ start:93 stop:638 length:546 start_codon:yes stop_codon:yes gene_type:complete